jgi:hypothetical protein
MKKIVILCAMLALTGIVFAQTTATKLFVAHQGGYVGEATVTIDKNGKVVSASLSEWQGPGGWAENNSADGKSIVDGAVVRVPDPFANLTNANPQVKGYTFYIYNQAEKGPGVWSQFAPGKDAFTRPARQYERDFEGLMANPLRAAAYVKAAKEDSLVNVTIDGVFVKVGKKASETVHYGNMDKANKNANYMPITKDSIGYRYNNEAMLAFFKANPTANFAEATTKKAKVTIKADKNVDVADASLYEAVDDTVYTVADAVTGATYSDFQHYSLELQTAYKMALAEQAVKFAK